MLFSTSFKDTQATTSLREVKPALAGGGGDARRFEALLNDLAAYALANQGKTSHYEYFNLLRQLALTGLAAASGGDPETSGEVVALERVKGVLGNIAVAHIVDAGANAGEWTLLAKQVMPNSIVTCIEAARANIDKLTRNLNGLDGVSILHAAVSNRHGELVDFYTDGEGSGHSSMYNKHMRSGDNSLGEIFISAEACYTITIDEMFSGQQIDMLKLDVEGAEFEALEGAERSIDKNLIKVIQFEVGMPLMDARRYFRDFWMMLSEKYHIAIIMKDGLKRIDSYHESMEVFMCQNYIAFRKDMV